MAWDYKEAVAYYARQGAPRDQTALVALLREVQQEMDGSIPLHLITCIAEEYKVKESFLTAVIRRIPALRLADTHTLQLCAGPNCGKHLALAALAESLAKENPGKFTLKFAQCMRMCGKGPNLKWDGVLYHKADEDLLRRLIEEA